MTARRRLAPLVMGVLLALSVVGSVGVGSAVAAGSAIDGAAVTNESDSLNSATANNSTRLVYDGQTLALDAGPGQVVRGETDLPAGTTLAVLLESSSGSKMFIMSGSATVTKDGRFRTTFDLADVPAGESMTVRVTHNGTTLAATNGTVTECTEDCAAPSPATPTASLDRDTVSLGAGPGRAIAGSTNLPPGTTVSVRIAASGDSVEFSANRSVTVGDDGRFRAVFDLSSVPAGTPIEVTVSRNGSRLARASGTVVACAAECTPPTPPQPADESADERNESQYDDLNGPDVTQGETARIELTFEPETVTLTVGGPQASYALNASVRDGNGDDRVVVLFATDKIGRGDAALSVANDSDSVSVLDERVTGDRSVIDEGEYLLVQSVGPTTTQPDDNPETFVVERGTLSVTDAPVDETGNETTVEEFGWPQVPGDDFPRQKVFRVRTDGTVRIPIRTDEVHTATLTVGSSASPYSLAAVLRDGTGDERVVVVFNASAAAENGSAPPLTAAHEGDTVTVTYQNGTLVPGEYDTDLYLGRVNTLSDWADADSYVVFGIGGQIVVAEGNSTPTMESHATGTPSDPTLSLGLLGLGGLLGALGIAFLVGLVEL